ncbi:MAG: hypothetical protein ACE5KY_06635, partial [Candidatus Tectimicrobiota bacterium]
MTEHHHGNEEEEQQAPPEKKVGSLPPRLAARIRRQQARRRLQERATQLGVPPGEEEEGPPSGDQPGQERAPEAEELVEVKAGPTDEPQPERPPVPEAEPPQAAPAPPLAPESPTLAPPVRLDAAPSTRPRAIVRREPAERPAPTKGRAADLRLRRFPTVTGVVQELGRGAWESVTALIASHLQRLKRRRILVERDHAFLTEEDLLERRPKVRGYVLASTIIHLLLFLPLISLAMIQEPEKKPPVFVRLLETPPPAKKIEKQKKNAESEKTTKRTTKVVKARGPRPAPRPVARPTVRKAYVSPKKVLVAKATQPTLKTTAPAIPKVAPARLEAPRPRSAPARLPQETVTKIAAPTRPVVLPKALPKVTSVTEALERQTPKEARPTVLEKDVAAVPDTEGRLTRLSDAFPKEFQVSDRLTRPTAPPSLPPTQTPAPTVLGQAAPVVSEGAPASASPLAPRVASSEARASN